jgi:hypothetical protein
VTLMKAILMGGAGLAALATAAPSAAQYYYGNPYGYSSNPYGYSTYSTNPYGYRGYAYGMNTSAAASQCTAAVQNRLYSRNAGGIIGALLGAYGTTGRVLSVTQVRPLSSGMTRVRGLASSGRTAYGYGYGAADLSFKCDVDYRGYVRDVDINRR